jgi:polar amino acid transport system substrate-binding protein
LKRLVAFAAALLVTTALAATAGASTASAPTMHPGQLVVAFGDPAVNFADGKLRGSNFINPKGYEVDLAKAIASRLHLTPKYVYAPWAKLFAPGSKSFDISFQEATITAARKRTVDFTDSYFNANQGVLLSKKAKTPHSIADLKGLQTCAQTDTTGLLWIQQHLHPSKAPLIYQSTSAAFVAVHVGRCDALILDTPIVASEKKARPNNYGAVAAQIVTHEQYGAVLQKNSKLTKVVDAQIKKLWANGTIAKLQKKWFNVNFNSMQVLK